MANPPSPAAAKKRNLGTLAYSYYVKCRDARFDLPFDLAILSTDSKEAMPLHNEVTAISEQLSEAEERWRRLEEEIEGACE